MNLHEELLYSIELNSALIQKLRGTLNDSYKMKADDGTFWSILNSSSVSKELEFMILKEIDSLEKENEEHNKKYDELISKEKVINMMEHHEFFKDFRGVNDSGYLFEILFILSSTDKAKLIEVAELGEIWIPKTQYKINGNLLFIREWWVDKKGYKGGEEIHLKDWEKLIPEHYNTSIVNQRYESEEDNSEDPNYCGACMESPCMCSDPY